MKKILFSILLLSTLISYSQIKTDSIEKTSVPFTLIEKVPVYPGCLGKDNKTLKKCFNQKTQKHIAKNFNTNLPNSLGLATGMKRIVMMFKINREGIVGDISVKSPHPKLAEECTRILKLLPKMIPGELKGKPVSVKYTLPLTIEVEAVKRKRSKRNKRRN